jgi:PEGA domain
MPILRILLVFILAVGATERAYAAAETSPSDSGIEDAIAQGIALRRAGNDEVALTVFLDLEKRAPDSVRVLLHITTAALATGKWILAYEYLQKAASHKDDPYYQRHKPAIENIERAIGQRVGQFRARGMPAGAEVRLSGEVVGTLPMTNPRAIEVGSYLLEVSKAGYFPLRRPVTVTGGGSITQEAIELREQKPFLGSSAPGQTALQGGGPLPDSAAPPAPSWWRARWVTWSLAGVGVAAAATSGVAFLIREQNAAHWNDDSRCLNSVNASQTREQVCGGVRDNVKLAEGVGVGAGIAAVAFGGAALLQWLATSHDRPAEPEAPPSLASGCSPSLGSVVCYGSF